MYYKRIFSFIMLVVVMMAVIVPSNASEMKFEKVEKANFSIVCRCREQPVEGVKVSVKNKKGKVIQKLTTDKNGFATTKELPNGEYKIVVKSVPDGYKLIGKKTISYKHNVYARTRWIYINFSENIQSEFTVMSKFDNGETLIDVKGAKYAVYDNKGNMVARLTTGSPVTQKLPDGEYTVVCTNVPKGYTLMNKKVTYTLSSSTRTRWVFFMFKKL